MLLSTTVALKTGVSRTDNEDTEYTISIFDYGVRVYDSEREEATTYPWHAIDFVIEGYSKTHDYETE